MAVNYNPLKSEYGFESPNFSVDISGNIDSNNISATVVTVSSVVSSAPQLTIGNFIFEDSTISTSDNTNIIFNNVEITNLESTDITVLSDFNSTNIRSIDEIELDSATRVTIKNSPLKLKSYTTTQRNALSAIAGDVIYNTTETTLNYYTDSWKSIGTGDIVINGTTITAGSNSNITIDPQGTGIVIVNDLQINNAPVEVYHATRKDYVDRTITALAIALGV